MFGFVLLFIACYCAFFNVFVFLIVFVFVHTAQCDGRRMDRSDGRSVRRAPSPSLTLDTHRLPSAFTDHHHHHHHHCRHCRRQRHPSLTDLKILVLVLQRGSWKKKQCSQPGENLGKPEKG